MGTEKRRHINLDVAGLMAAGGGEGGFCRAPSLRLLRVWSPLVFRRRGHLPVSVLQHLDPGHVSKNLLSLNFCLLKLEAIPSTSQSCFENYPESDMQLFCFENYSDSDMQCISALVSVP